MNSSSVPLISVVLPVYNVEKYIKESLQSIFDQTFQDFEVIIIDDCSTDNTLKEISFFNDKRIKIIKKSQNKGLIDSLNIGFEKASGKYIARADGDDINTADRFEKQLKILQSNQDIKACGSWIACFGFSETVLKYKENHNEIQARLLISNPMALGACMLEKEAYKTFLFLNNKVHVEDYDFWARTSWVNKTYNIQEVLYHYRIHEKQVSTQFKKIQLAGDIDIKLSLFKKLEYNENYFTDSLITKILYTNEAFSQLELKTVFEWFQILRKNNTKLNIFDKKNFLNVIHEIEFKLIYEIFFTNRKQNLNYQLRLGYFKIITLRFKLYVMKKKIAEKFKTLKNKIV